MEPEVMKRNVELIDKIIDKLRTTPEAYDQRVYGRSSSFTPCGTAACIAGWAAYLSHPELVPLNLLQGSLYDGDIWNEEKAEAYNVDEIAREALGITEFESGFLFSAYPGGSWPEPFATQWKMDGERRKQAKVAIAMLEYVKAGGELGAKE